MSGPNDEASVVLLWADIWHPNPGMRFKGYNMENGDKWDFGDF
jgi:hypothetical protein